MSGPAAPAGPSEPVSRRLGRSGVEVAPLALGTSGIANLYTPVTEEQAREAVRTALRRGIRSFDTAPPLRPRPRRTPPRRRPARAAPRHVHRVHQGGPPARTVRRGRRRPRRPRLHRPRHPPPRPGLQRRRRAPRYGGEPGTPRPDRVDVVRPHDLDDHEEQAFRVGHPALERLRSKGVVRAIGAGMNRTAMLTRFVRDTDVDVALCANRHTLLDASASAELPPAAPERGVSVVGGGAFDSGLPAHPRPGATYDYARAPAALLERALRIKEAAGRHGTSPRAAALAHCAAHPAVAAVLVGARSAAEVDDCADRFADTVPDALWEDLRASGLL